MKLALRSITVEQEEPLNFLVQECLKSLGITLLCDWDVLVFLYRHQSSLASAEQIARFLGYPSEVVGDALDTLESLRLMQRSRASQGVRLYEFVFPGMHLLPEGSFRQLMSLAENRTGRLLLAKKLRQQQVDLHLAGKGSAEWLKVV